MEDLSKYSFLLVDDFKYILEINDALITGIGAKAEQACDGRQAFEKFQNSEIGYYDVILTDIEMPNMDGWEMTQEIRRLDRADAKSIIIIALTFYSNHEEVHKSIKAGIDAHICKPLHLGEIEKIIQNIKEARSREV